MDTQELFTDGLEHVLAPEPSVLKFITYRKNVFGNEFLEVLRSFGKSLQVDFFKCM